MISRKGEAMMGNLYEMGPRRLRLGDMVWPTSKLKDKKGKDRKPRCHLEAQRV